MQKKTAQSKHFRSSYISFPISYLKDQVRQNTISKCQLHWNIEDAGRYTHNFLPYDSTNFRINNRLLMLLLTKHSPFQLYLYEIGKRTAPLCISNLITVSLHYEKQCALTPAYLIKNHDQMSLHDWLTYILNRTVSSNRVIECKHLIEKNEFLFQNHYPYFDDPAQTMSPVKSI